MSINAYIFVRAGSKGLPGKNKMRLAGFPLYAHAIKHAKDAGIFQAVYVSTDDMEIANDAPRYGAEVIIRPRALCEDDSPELLSWRHALGNSRSCDIFVSVPATSPLRSPADIVAVVKGLQETNTNKPHHDACVTVTTARRNPYYQSVVVDETAHLKPLFGDGLHQRQVAPLVYDVVGVAYAAYPHYIMRAARLFDGVVNGVIIPEDRALDIDTAHDFRIAEYFLGDTKVADIH